MSPIVNTQLIEGRDYEAKIAFSNKTPFEATDNPSVNANEYNTEFLSKKLGTQVQNNDIIVKVRIWSEKGATSQKMLFPLKDLLLGQEEKVITVFYNNKFHRLLCSQMQSRKAPMQFENWTLSQKSILWYIPRLYSQELRNFDFAKYVESNREAAISPITRYAPVIRELPNMNGAQARNVQLLQYLQTQREEGKTDFYLIVRDGLCSKKVPVHRVVLCAYSDYFAARNSSEMSKGMSENSDTIEASIDSIEQLLNFLYLNTVNSELTIDQLLNLLSLCEFLQLKSCCLDLFDICLQAIRTKMSNESVWKVICRAAALEKTELLDLASLYLIEKNINLLDFIDLKEVLNFVELSGQVHIPFIPFICDQLNQKLLLTLEPSLSKQLYEFSEKNQKLHPSIAELFEIFKKLALRFPKLFKPQPT